VSSQLHLTITVANLLQDPLSSYKRKDDLVTLCGALGLKMTGTVNELATQLKSHLSTHPELQQNPRFSGLFSQSRRRRAEIAVDTLLAQE
jgi:hypothetical protein